MNALQPGSPFMTAVEAGRASQGRPLSDPQLPLRQLPYQYGFQCSGCSHASACLAAACAGRGELQLAGCSAAEARDLQQHAVAAAAAAAQGGPGQAAAAQQQRQLIKDLEDLASIGNEGLSQAASAAGISFVRARRLRQAAQLRRALLGPATCDGAAGAAGAAAAPGPGAVADGAAAAAGAAPGPQRLAPAGPGVPQIPGSGLGQVELAPFPAFTTLPPHAQKDSGPLLQVFLVPLMDLQVGRGAIACVFLDEALVSLPVTQQRAAGGVLWGL